MAKIPDIGQTSRPTPRPSRGIASQDTSGVNRAGQIVAQDAAQVGQGTSDLMNTISGINEKIMAGEARLQARREVVDQAGTIGQFRQQLTDGLTSLEDAGTIADSKHVANYENEINTAMQAHLQSWEGSEEGRLALRKELEEERTRFVMSAAAKSRQAGIERVQNLYEGELNEEMSRVIRNPGDLQDAIARVHSRIEKSAPVMSEDWGVDTRRAATSALVLQSATGILQKNPTTEGIETVQSMLMDPRLTSEIDADTQARIAGRLLTARQAIVTAQADAMKKRAEFVAIHGRDPNPAEAHMLTNTAPKQENLVEVGDETSPTGSRFVPESEARGMPGRPRSPLIQNINEDAFLKRLGEKDADRVDKIFNDAMRAERDLDEIDRMRAALESGNFETGFAGNARANVSRALELFGVNGAEVSELIGDAATADTMEAASARLAVQAAQDGGRLTNMFLSTVRESLPALTRTPGGNAILLDVMERVAKRQIELGQLADRYTQEHGTLRPKEGMTFYEEVRRMEEEDPVISAELKARIAEAAETAPKSWEDIVGEDTSGPEAPEGYVFEKSVGGFDYFRAEEGGQLIRRPSDG